MSYGAGMIPVTFAGGDHGEWQIERVVTVRGTSLPSASRLAVLGSHSSVEGAFVLRGVTSSARYLTSLERPRLDAASPPLGRPEATHAVLVPIRKSSAWWSLAQDERRAIFEERSGHVARSLRYLPRIARRLHHARELGEPFDFLTWFEHAPEHTATFDELLGLLRESEEWSWVEREVEVRLVRGGPGPSPTLEPTRT
jgi:hypothetical protein